MEMHGEGQTGLSLHSESTPSRPSTKSRSRWAPSIDGGSVSSRAKLRRDLDLHVGHRTRPIEAPEGRAWPVSATTKEPGGPRAIASKS